MRRVLLIERDADRAAPAAEALKGRGWTVERRADASELRGGFDAIVAGSRELDHVRSLVERGEAPVIALVEPGDPQAAARARDAGATAWAHASPEWAELLPWAVESATRAAERDRLMDALSRAEEPALLGLLASGVVEQLSDPLAAVAGFADLLATGTVADPREAVERLGNAARRCAQVARSLSAATAGGPAPGEECPLREIVESALPGVEEAAASGIRRAVELPSPDILVEADPPALLEALRQILLNALEAMQGEGVLRIGWAARGEKVKLWVQDTGPGIPPEAEPRIFDAFYSTRGRSGLGLTLARSVVRRHGGKLWHEKPSEGGARFVIALRRL